MLQDESHATASHEAPSRQTLTSSRKRSAEERHKAAVKAVQTKGKAGLRAAATKAAKTRARHPTAKGVAVEPSGPRGDNPSTAGPGQTKVQSNTPENNSGHLNPSAPEDVNITPGTAGTK